MAALKSILLVSVLALIFSIPSFAQAGEVLTKGDVDCGKWLDLRTTNHAEVYETHILGYINGYAVGTNQDIWRTGKNPISADQSYVWLDKYCKENPLSSPFEGIFLLFQEIFSQQ